MAEEPEAPMVLVQVREDLLSLSLRLLEVLPVEVDLVALEADLLVEEEPVQNGKLIQTY